MREGQRALPLRELDAEGGAWREHRQLSWLILALAVIPVCLLLLAVRENVSAARQFVAVEQSASLGTTSLWIYAVTQPTPVPLAGGTTAPAPAAIPAPITLPLPAPSAAPVPSAVPGAVSPGQETQPTSPTPTAPPDGAPAHAGPAAAGPSLRPLLIFAADPVSAATGDWPRALAGMEERLDWLRALYPREVQAADPAWAAFAGSLRSTGHVDWDTADRMRGAADTLSAAIRARAVQQKQQASVLFGVGILALVFPVWKIFSALHGLRRVERVLWQERKERDALLESTGEGIFGLDQRGDCTFINATGARMLGYRPQDLRGKNMHSLIRHSHADGSPYPVEEDPIFQALQRGQVIRRDDEVLWARDGTSFAAEYTASPILREGQMQGAVVTFADITERKRLETLRDDLTGMIIHDLRTPLTSLLSGLQTLESICTLDEGQKEVLDISIQGGHSLLGMINDLLDISKMEAGSLKLELRELTPRDLLDYAMQQTAPLARENGLKVARNIAPDLPRFLGDEDKLRRALVNLLGNAVKFTPRGGIVTLAAMVDAGENTLVFAVGDTGEGIPAHAVRRIFEKFGQVESRKAGRKQSTGLGLTFCKLVAEAHGGRIWVESKLGKGSRFAIAVPLSPRPAGAVAGGVPQTSASAPVTP